MTETLGTVSIPDIGTITIARTTARRATWTFVYAPGAGSNIDDPFGRFAAGALAHHGITTVRFQFPYMEVGRRSPDRPAILESTWRAAIERGRNPRTKLVVGGRSMGGRIASMIVASGTGVDALALFAYPLHPPGHNEKLRVEHLPQIKTPTLFCSGTNDAFGSPPELRSAAKKVPGAKLHLLDSADHGFAVKKSTGRTRDDVYAEAVNAFVEWLGDLPST